MNPHEHSGATSAHDPHLACTVDDDRLGLVGHLVIHNLVGGRSLGGVRLVADANLDEMTAAARSMAYKHGFIGLPIGGAKAALAIGDEDGRDERLMTFGKALAPLIANGTYVPAVDMNCTLEDLQVLFRGAGLERDWSWRTFASHEYTAWTCFIATMVGLNARGIDVEAATFAVQGFGRVGGAYAELMSDAGARLVAVSNRIGAGLNDRGFRVAELRERWRREGDQFLLDFPDGEHVSSDDVLTAPVSVLLPAARAWAINEDNWANVEAPLVVCAANVAMSDDVERRLFERGTTVVTDFVANCGGVLGSILDRELDRTSIWKILDTAYRRKVSQLIAGSSALGAPLCAVARSEIEGRLAGWRKTTQPRLANLERWLRRLTPGRSRAAHHLRFYEALWSAGDADEKIRK